MKQKNGFRILIPCLLCLAVLTAGVLYVQAAGRSKVKSIQISIGSKKVTKKPIV